MDFERLARDAERCVTFRERRLALLGAVGEDLGIDSGHLTDAPEGRAAEAASGTATLGMFSFALMQRYLEDRQRYDLTNDRLLAAMRRAPVIDTEIYSSAERAVVPVYAEVLVPQRTRSILAAYVHLRGRAVAQIVLKRHAGSAPFTVDHATRLAQLLPAIALADVGFRWPDERPSEVAGAESLTPREAQVARLACEGLSNRAIGLVLGTSRETVKKQLENVLGKIGVANRTELAAWYARRGSG